MNMPEDDQGPCANLQVAENKTIRNRQYITYTDGSQWTRKLIPQAAEAWTLIETAVAHPEREPLELHVVAHHQAEREPKHWSLFATRPSSGRMVGQEWQVTGDAECMHFEHVRDAEPFASETFAWQQLVNGDLDGEQLQIVEDVVRMEAPPKAKDRRSVTENCQGWTVRVVRRLAALAVAEEKSVRELEKRMDPLK